MVGARGFEPPASWSRTRRASQAALRPDNTHSGVREKQPEWNTQNNIALRLILERDGLDTISGAWGNEPARPCRVNRGSAETRECAPECARCAIVVFQSRKPPHRGTYSINWETRARF